jgi:hypothetical protein
MEAKRAGLISQVRAWFLETFTRARVAPRLSLSLYSSFIASGSQAPICDWSAQ